MYRTVGTSLVVALVIAGCSGPEGDETSARVAAVVTAPVADTSGGGGMDHDAMASRGGMQGMDHGSMQGMQHGQESSGEMEGMDHSNMPGMSGSDRPREQAGDQAMDHSRMSAAPPVRSGGMAGMDHSSMPGMQTSAARQQGMQGMDHANMPGMRDSDGRQQEGMAGMDHGRMGGMHPAAGVSADGTDKLMMLVAELVRDPAVQERIRQDSVLGASWEDPDVRRILLNRP